VKIELKKKEQKRKIMWKSKQLRVELTPRENEHKITHGVHLIRQAAAWD
jgi:hypothetical protein